MPPEPLEKLTHVLNPSNQNMLLIQPFLSLKYASHKQLLY